MSRKSKKDEVDLLEGFDFESVLAGEINGPEAFVPSLPVVESAIKNLVRNSTQDLRQPSGNPKIDRQPLDSHSPAISYQLDSKIPLKAAIDRQPLDSHSPAAEISLDSHYTADWTAGNFRKTAIRQPLDSHSPATEWTFDRIGGKEAELVQFIFQACLNSGSMTTGKIATDGLRKSMKVTTRRLSNLIERLGEKKLLAIVDSKRGNGAFRQFSLPERVFKEMRLSELASSKTANRQQIDSHYTADWTADKTASPPSSSREFFLNNSTTTQNVDNFDSDANALKNLDFSIVTEFGITSSTLNRCRELYPSVSNDQLAALTERFGQFMKTSDGKRVQNARGFFISLAEQLSKGVTPLDHIETHSEALMREFVERAKEAKGRRDLLEKEAFEFAFEEWVENLDFKTRDELVPPNSVIEGGSKIQTIQLKEHFRVKVWPTRFDFSTEAHGAET